LPNTAILSAPVSSDLEHWRVLACHTPLGILTDLDGTLVPFAATPEEVHLDAERVAVLRDLSSLPGVRIAVVSGRSRESLERLLSDVPDVIQVAEHGGWKRATGAWQATTDADPAALGELARVLEGIAARHPGALVERKTWSVTFHYRGVRPSERDEALIETAAAVDPWLAAHAGFERLDGVLVVEVRHVRNRKSVAVPWLRDIAGPGARLLAFGDELTDEDMFRALGPADEAILVGGQQGRGTFARWKLLGSSTCLSFLRWIVALRRE